MLFGTIALLLFHISKVEAKVLVPAYAGGYPVTVCQANDTATGCSGVAGSPLTPWTSNINGGGYSLTNAGGLTTYDNANSQNSVVIGNHSWTGDNYSGYPITIGQYRYTSDPNAPYGIQNNWLYGQQDGDPYFFYADAPGAGTLYFGDLYNNYGGANFSLSSGATSFTSPAGVNMNISSSSFRISTSANYNSFYIDGTTGAINSPNTEIDNDGQGTFIVNSNENSLTNAFSVMDGAGFNALQVNNSDSLGRGDYVQTLNNVLDDGSGNAHFAGSLTTANNTLDDGNGNLSAYGTITGASLHSDSGQIYTDGGGSLYVGGSFTASAYNIGGSYLGWDGSSHITVGTSGFEAGNSNWQLNADGSFYAGVNNFYVDSSGNSTSVNLKNTGQRIDHSILKTSNYTIAAGDSLVICGAYGATFTLPAASSNTGRIITVKNEYGSGGSNTIASAGGNIDGASTVSLGLLKSRTVQSDGTNWQVIGGVF